MTKEEDEKEISSKAPLAVTTNNIEIFTSSKKGKNPSDLSNNMHVRNTTETPNKTDTSPLDTVAKPIPRQLIMDNDKDDHKDTIAPTKNQKGQMKQINNKKNKTSDAFPTTYDSNQIIQKNIENEGDVHSSDDTKTKKKKKNITNDGKNHYGKTKGDDVIEENEIKYSQKKTEPSKTCPTEGLVTNEALYSYKKTDVLDVPSKDLRTAQMKKAGFDILMSSEVKDKTKRLNENNTTNNQKKNINIPHNEAKYLQQNNNITDGIIKEGTSYSQIKNEITDKKPIHEAKTIQRKEEKPNDNLNYTMTSECRAINKIPKGRYGFIEDYDLQKAEKFLSKRKTDIKYDNNVVYGKATQNKTNQHGGDHDRQSNIYDDEMINKDMIDNITTEKDSYCVSAKKEKPTTSHLDKDNNKVNTKTIRALIRKKKDNIYEENGESQYCEYDHLNADNQYYENPMEDKDNQLIRNNDRYSSLKKRDISPITEEKEEDLHPVKAKNKKPKKKPIDNTNDQNKGNDPLLNNSQNPNPANKNYELLFADNNNPNTQTPKSQKITHDQGLLNDPNMNYSLLDYNDAHSEQIGNSKGNDLFSCENCEPIYRMSILNNIPLKVLKCMICGNIINTASLDFYLNKYKNELENQKRMKNQEEATEAIAADENGINENWGNWINMNKNHIKEQYIYDVLDGKIKVKENKKQQMHNDYQNTPYEDIFKRKNCESLRTAKRSTISNSHHMTHDDYYTEPNTADVQRRAKLIDFTKKLEQEAYNTKL